jgi:predicted  nucleic acid-binding Zn-ribbon protein
MVRIAELDRLQQVDLDVDSAESELAEIEAQLNEAGPLAALRERESALQAALTPARATLRQAETEAEDGREKVGAVAQKLYGGTVTATRELQDLQHELEALQRQQQERDDRALQAMSGVEEIETSLQALRLEIAETEQQSGAAASELQSRAAELHKTLDALHEKRAQAARPIDAATLALYERLRRRWNGKAVARVQRGVCLGCRIMLPSNLFNRARSGMTVVQCSNCERILYVG